MRTGRYVTLFLALVVSICSATVGNQPGRLINDIRCRHAPDYSYMLYLPSGYAPGSGEKWPVMFVMGPDGGSKDGIARYIQGAELNNWMVAMSIQSSNKFRPSQKAVSAMVVDMLERFEVDDRRCYASGMWGGSRLAFWLANKKPKMIAGIIPCGTGDAGALYDNLALVYGLCGARSFARWEMAVAFKQRIHERGRLRFFEGGHVWADEDHIATAMVWLNAQHLKRRGSKEDMDLFSERVFNDLLNRYDTNTLLSYERAVILASVDKAPHAKQAQELVDGLAIDPRIEPCIQGWREMDRFVARHFGTDPLDYVNHPLTRVQRDEAAALLSLYKDTPLAGIIEDFGQPPDKP